MPAASRAAVVGEQAAEDGGAIIQAADQDVRGKIDRAAPGKGADFRIEGTEIEGGAGHQSDGRAHAKGLILDACRDCPRIDRGRAGVGIRAREDEGADSVLQQAAAGERARDGQRAPRRSANWCTIISPVAADELAAG